MGENTGDSATPPSASPASPDVSQDPGSALLPMPTKRPTYPQDWPAYDAAQREEWRVIDDHIDRLLHPDIVKEPQRSKHAADFISVRDAAFCTLKKVYLGMSCRRTEAVYRDLHERGYIDRVPSFPVASRFLLAPGTSAILQRLLERTALVLVGEDREWAFDSTGFATTNRGFYRHDKHGEKTRREYRKLHMAVGTKTHVIASATVTDHQGEGTGDPSQFVPVLDGLTNWCFPVDVVYADAAYSTRVIREAAHAAGAQAFIPFKAGARPRRAGGTGQWNRDLRWFAANPDAFKQHYHQRSNVEAGISAIKRKFGDNITSKVPKAQDNEILAKVIVYNLTALIRHIHTARFDPGSFWEVKPRAPPKPAPLAVPKPVTRSVTHPEWLTAYL